jgi:hypothetical protein
VWKIKITVTLPTRRGRGRGVVEDHEIFCIIQNAKKEKIKIKIKNYKP